MSATAPALPVTLRLGPAHLVVTSLERSVPYYEHGLGVRERWRDGAAAGLGAGEDDVVVLHEEPAARPAGRHAGLFHVAYLYPTRAELGHAARRLAEAGTAISGASDHGTHEAIYLRDPDGNGIELAADRPRERWPRMQDYAGGPAPLDVPDLLRAGGDGPLPPHAEPGLRVGHVHLHVGSIAEGLRFFCDRLGFELQVELGTAAFVSAGGYHHHLGFNTWQGEGVGPAPADAVGLRHWTIELDTPEQVAEVAARLPGAEAVEGGVRARDPWGTAFVVRAAGLR